MRYGVFNDDTDTSSSGNFTFVPQITALPNMANTGNGFASFLLGEVNAANIIRPDPIRSRATYWGGYVQDDWRVSDGLTVNLGLRWETTLARITDEDRMNAFDSAAINPVLRSLEETEFHDVHTTPIGTISARGLGWRGECRTARTRSFALAPDSYMVHR